MASCCWAGAVGSRRLRPCRTAPMWPSMATRREAGPRRRKKGPRATHLHPLASSCWLQNNFSNPKRHTTFSWLRTTKLSFSLANKILKQQRQNFARVLCSLDRRRRRRCCFETLLTSSLLAHSFCQENKRESTRASFISLMFFSHRNERAPRVLSSLRVLPSSRRCFQKREEEKVPLARGAIS